MTCDLFPAIDLLGGRCVRLLRGSYDDATHYDIDPVSQALAFEAAGAQWVHVVDLDAARSGEATNREVIASIADALGVPVQTGGGVRGVADARALFDAGVRRVVMGTAAMQNPSLVGEVAEHGAVAVGLDVDGRDVAILGWTESSGCSIADAIGDFAGLGAAAFVVTQIRRDGTLEGPDIELLRETLDATDTPVVASGGVGTLDDLGEIAKLASTEPGLEGVIVGKALYEGAVQLDEALAVFETEEA